jgi:hypothetical protein
MVWETNKRYGYDGTVWISVPRLPPSELLPRSARQHADRVAKLKQRADGLRAMADELARGLAQMRADHQQALVDSAVKGEDSPTDPTVEAEARIAELRGQASALDAAIDEPMAAFGEALQAAKPKLVETSEARVVDTIGSALHTVDQLEAVLRKLATESALLHWSRALGPTPPSFKGGISGELTEAVATIRKILGRAERDARGSQLSAVDEAAG